jgi:hypothetical protein
MIGSRSETRGNSIFGVVAILSGVSFLVHLGVVAALPSANTYQEVSVYRSNQTIFTLLLLSMLAFTMFGIAFSAGLSRMLAPRSSMLAASATLTLTAGILVTGLGIVLSIGALAAIAQLPSDSAYNTSAAFEGAFWANLQGLTNSFGDGLMGIGLLLLGVVAWDSKTVPNWLAIIGIVGGAGAFLAIASDALSIVSFGAFTVWSIAVGYIILRGPRKEGATEPNEL